MQCKNCKHCCVTYKHDYEIAGNEYANGQCWKLNQIMNISATRDCVHFSQRPDPKQLPLFPDGMLIGAY